MRDRSEDPAARKARHEKRAVEQAAKFAKRMEREKALHLPNRFEMQYGAERLSSCGPQFVGNWGVPLSIRDALARAGRSAPDPVVGALLLDTGATRTCIALEAATQLGLQPKRMEEGMGAGGKHRNPVFLARLEIHIQHPLTGEVNPYAWEQEVQGITDLHLAPPLSA
jgi:hypothetical protein